MATLITKNSSTASAVPAAGDLVKGELAVNVTDKKVYTKDNSAAVVKLVGSLGNQEANAVAVTGGTINGTTIGATTPSTGAFTTASASSGFTGNLTGNVTGNVSGTAANVTGVVAIANGGTGLSTLGTGVQSALGQAVTGSGSFVLSTSPSLTTPNLGTPSAAVLTNATGLPLTTGVTGTLGVANGGTGITAFGTGVATALGQNVTGSGGIVLATSPSLTTPNLGTPSAATLTNATGLPISTGVSGLGTGVATALGVAVGSAGAFVTNGGALGTPSSGTVTNLTGTASININGTVGATTPTTGAFTTLSASGNITVSGGTANGVAYLNGSKVLTTGSALTFSGSQLNVNGSFLTQSATILPTSGAATLSLLDVDNRTLQIKSPDPIGNQATIQTTTNHQIVFGINSTEQMRLTSTGLGIGTSSPSERLEVVGVAKIRTGGGSGIQIVSAATPYIQAFGASGNNVLQLNGQSISFWSGASYGAESEKMRLDSSGNLGLGVTPSAWSSSFKALNIGVNGQSVSADGGQIIIGSNYVQESGGAKYVVSAAAGSYAITRNSHYWYIAPSGTAGNAISFTQAMTLDASGNLLVGTTSSTYNSAGRGVIELNGSSDNIFAMKVAGAQNFYVQSNATNTAVWNVANTYMSFGTNNTERARITSGGDFLVGATATTNGARFRAVGNGSYVSWIEQTSNNANSGVFIYLTGNRASNTTDLAIRYGDDVNNRFQVLANGDVQNTNNSYGAVSDVKLKENIVDASPKLADLMQVKVRNYNLIGETSKQIGVVAQELEQVFPNMVGESPDRDAEGNDLGTTTKSVKYSVFVPMLIKAIQEQQAIITDLRARVAQLEAK